MRELKFQYGENILISFRNGSLVNCLAKVLVCGDIVVIATGDRVPADMRLVEAVDLEIDESSFTGETEPQRKDTSSIPEALENSRVTEQKNVAFMGTSIYWFTVETKSANDGIRQDENFQTLSRY
ncbi:calcium-transporting ATPase 1-like [Xenia sp. Carnegie-2017]|uniref:calcium-transporting ATPase 1-like n=1 Tax=Xenia sp. Carnegie-2017 TaxID=2897299 RepID=UPI001F04D996|nr:calcium-transporting ATPase 1-like [Xenia sp. Carnegie-2017]